MEPVFLGSVAFSVSACPTAIVALVGDTVTLPGAAFTVTLQLFSTPLSSLA